MATLASMVDLQDGGAANVQMAGVGLGFLDKVIGGLFGGGEKKTEVIVQQPMAASGGNDIFGGIAQLVSMTVLERVLDKFLGPAPAGTPQPAAPMAPTSGPSASSLAPKSGIDNKTLLIVGGGVAAVAVVAVLVAAGRRR